MHRSSVHWLYDKLEMPCYALYRMILNPLHWVGYTLKVQPELWRHGRREMSQAWHFYVLESKWLYFKVILIRYLSLSLGNMVWSASYFNWFYPEDNVVYKPQFMFCQVTLVLVSCGNSYLYSVSVDSWSDFGPRMSISGAR